MTNTELYDALIHDLKRDEGVKLNPYKCTAGKLTIGVGRNLDDVGITEEESDMLLKNDLCVHDGNQDRSIRPIPCIPPKPEN